MLRPAHLADVDETLYTGLHLYEGTVVGEDNDLAGHLVTYLETLLESVPGMGGELLQTEGDTLTLLIIVEDNDIDLLTDLDHLLGVIDTTPREVGDVYQTVDTTEVDEGTVGGDVLHRTLEYLTLLEVRDDLGTLCLELLLDECLVRYDDIVIVGIDLDDAELHRLADKLLEVADRTDVDL